jgi:hypothetical protein
MRLRRLESSYRNQTFCCKPGLSCSKLSAPAVVGWAASGFCQCNAPLLAWARHLHLRAQAGHLKHAVLLVRLVTPPLALEIPLDGREEDGFKVARVGARAADEGQRDGFLAGIPNVQAFRDRLEGLRRLQVVQV